MSIISVDKTDQKILINLSQNLRIPISLLAKKVHMSREAVVYRINRMEQNKIIKGYKLNINSKLLGYKEYDIYLKVLSIEKKIFDEMIKDLVANKFITWVGTTFGGFDVRVSMLAIDNEQVQNNLEEFFTKYSRSIEKKEIVEVIKKYKLQPEVFIKEIFPDIKLKNSPKLINIFNKQTKVNLDLKDKQLLIEMGKNPLISFVNLAKTMKITPEGVSARYKNLQKNGTIKGSFVLINGPKLGYLWGVINFRIHGLNNEKEKEIERFISNLKGVTSAVRLFGEWDFGITLFAKSLDEFQEKSMKIKAQFTDIKDSRTMIILDTFKYPTLAEGIFN